MQANAGVANKKRRGEGQRLSEAQRLEIIEMIEQPAGKKPSMRSIARMYGVNDKTIRNVLAASQEIKSRAVNMEISVREKTFRIGKPQHPDLEEKLYEFIEGCRRLSIELPPSMVIAKAKQLAEALPDCQNFQASWGWYRNFRTRRGLQSILLHGEGGEVDRNNPQTLQALQNLEEIIKEYDPSCVYNMDETGVFYRLLPRYSVLLPSEDLSTARGKKKSKERVTLVVCCNATGTERVPVAMIGKAKESACIAGRQWPLPYFNQKKAWVDIPVFNQWFDQVFRPYVRRRTGRKVILILDNAPGHFQPFEKDGIRVAFFPPNVTSWKQPMDMGIIAALKKRYKFMLMKDILTYHDLTDELKMRLATDASKMKRGAAGVEFGRPAHLLDAANYTVKAWNTLTPETLKNCFRKADIIPEFRSVSLQSCDGDNVDNMVSELVSMMENCTVSPVLANPGSQLSEEIRLFLIEDEQNSEEYQQAVIEDIEDELGSCGDEEEQGGNDETPQEEPQTIDEEVVKKSIHDIFLQVVDLNSRLRDLPGSQFLAQESIDEMLNSMFSVKNTIQQAVSKISREKIDGSRQMTIFDFGFTRSQ